MNRYAIISARKQIQILKLNQLIQQKLLQFIPLYDIIIGDGYGYLINSRSVGLKGVCPWGKHLGYALLLPQKCAPALARIVAESWVSWRFYGVVCLVRRSGGYHGGFTAFSVRYSGVVTSKAVLYFRYNYSRVVNIVAVIHHKVVASLRLDQTHPTAHKDCGFPLSNSSYKNLRDGVETY